MYQSELKDCIDIVSTIEAVGTELKRSGSRHVGLCPFHADNNPSFTVFPDGRFKCFGCGEHGDAIDFVQKYHGVDFKGALQILGIEQSKLTPQKRQEVKRVQHRHELAKAFRQWEIEAVDEAAMLCRCCRKVLHEIRKPEDLEKYGDRYHDFETYQYNLDVLTSNDDEAKLGLYDAGYYN